MGRHTSHIIWCSGSRHQARYQHEPPARAPGRRPPPADTRPASTIPPCAGPSSPRAPGRQARWSRGGEESGRCPPAPRRTSCPGEASGARAAGSWPRWCTTETWGPPSTSLYSLGGQSTADAPTCAEALGDEAGPRDRRSGRGSSSAGLPGGGRGRGRGCG